MQIQNALPTGTRIGDYVIQRPLGAGGFGITYLATDPRDGKQWAVKEFFPREFFASNSVTDPDRTDESQANFQFALGKFIKEGELLYGLNHANIVSVASKPLQTNRSAYIVMEFVEGLSLDAWLKNFDTPPTEAQLQPIFLKVMSAVEYLHANSFMHRDLSPDNIMIRPGGEPVLIDFGTAGEGLDRSGTTLQFRKDFYSPIEQGADDSQQGAYTDIYALGAVLYRSVTGNPPARALSRASTVLSKKPDPYVLVENAVVDRSSYSPQFCAAINRALSVNAEDRPQNIAEFRRELGWVGVINQPVTAVAPHIPPAPGIPPSNDETPLATRKKRNLALMFGAAFMVLAGFGGLTWLSGQRAEEKFKEQQAQLDAIKKNLQTESESLKKAREQAEKERKAAADKVRDELEKQKKLAAEQAKAELEKQRREAVAKAKAELDKQQREAAAREQARKAALEAEMKQREADLARKAAADQARAKKAAEEAEKARKVAQDAEKKRLAQLKADQEARRKLELERQARLAKERAERAAAQKAERERKAREAAAAKARDDAEKTRLARIERERKALEDQQAAERRKLEQLRKELDERIARITQLRRQEQLNKQKQAAANNKDKAQTTNPPVPARVDLTNAGFVRELQTRLFNLGYDVGAIDGRWRAAYTQILVAFQKANALPQTGQLDGGLRDKIFAAPVPEMWGAIALSKKKRRWGMSWGQKARQAAQNQAIATCGRNQNCDKIFTFHTKTCAAFVVSAKRWEVATGPTVAAARKEGEKQCKKESGNCRIIANVCADGSNKFIAN